jgi:polar amino acid transport system substrate-binding protein
MVALPFSNSWAQAPSVLIGAEDDWLPYSGERQGRACGMTVDLVASAFAACGIAARFDALPHARCLAQTQSGALVACFNTQRAAQTEDDFLWPARPLFEERYLIYARADEAREIGQLHELEHQTVAVTRGHLYDAAFADNPRIQRLVTSRNESNFRLVQMGRARYTLAPERNTQALFDARPELAGHFKVVGRLPPVRMYTAFSKRHAEAPQMLAAFDQGMKTIHANGTARAIQERWRQPVQAPV